MSENQAGSLICRVQHPQSQCIEKRSPLGVTLVRMWVTKELGIQKAVHRECRIFVQPIRIHIFDDDKPFAGARCLTDDRFRIGSMVQNSDQQAHVEAIVREWNRPAVVDEWRYGIYEAEVLDVERSHIDSAILQDFADVASARSDVENRITLPDVLLEPPNKLLGPNGSEAMNEPSKQSSAL